MLRKFSVVAVLLLTAVMTLMPVGAQMDAPPVLILPINNANFLPGAKFDFRVEVHAEVMPEDFAVTINGVDASEFTGMEGMMENWVFGANSEGQGGTPSQSMIWRDLEAPAPGEYIVEVVAGGMTHSVTWIVREPATERVAQNVILFVADGGSVGLFTAARLVSRGMTQGTYNGQLSFETFEEIGLVHTSGIDSIITDSANSASSYNTGHKTAVNATGSYPDTSPDALDDPRTETFAAMIRRTLGMSVGIVTTSDFTDATPAAVWAAGRNRGSGNRAAYAAQALDMMPEVILGGGGQYLIPQSTEGSRRRDDMDLFAMYEEAGYSVALTNTELSAAVEGGAERLLGIFHPSDLNVWLDRNVYTDNLRTFTDQPGLVEMTTAALEVLSQNENGFYLMVEAASIDKQLHPMDFERALADAIEFDRTIAATIEWLETNGMLEDTLIVVTADHAHSFDVFGTVDTEAFNAATDDATRRDAIQTYNGAGFPSYADEDGDFYPDSWDVAVTLAYGKVEAPDHTENYQVSPVPRVPAVKVDGAFVDNPEDDPNGIFRSGNLPLADGSSSVHTLQDVPVYAHGPGSAVFGRAIENIEIFFGMAAALGLNPAHSMGMMGN